MRRVIVWAVVISVILSGVLSGNRSVAQDDGPTLWMVVYECEPNTSDCTLMLQDPYTQVTVPLSREQLLGYLRDGSLQYDIGRELYQWRDYSILLPDGVFLVEAVAGQYYQDEQGLIWRTWAQPSPDWQWVVYRLFDELYAVNLDEGLPRPILTGTGLHLEGDWLHLAFEPNSSWIYVSAVDTAGNTGIYHLSLEAANSASPVPIIQNDYVPLIWLQGKEQLLIERAFNADLLITRFPDVGTSLVWLESDEFRQVYFVGWLSDKNLLLIYSPNPSSNPNSSLYGLSLDPDIGEEMRWGVLQWRPIGLTNNQEWLFAMQGQNTLGRIRTDGSQLETIASVPGEIIEIDNEPEIAYSPDGKWLSVLTYERLFLVNVETRNVTELDSGITYWHGFTRMEWSPDSQKLFYWKQLPNYQERELIVYDTKGNATHQNWPIEHGFIAWLELDHVP